MSLDPRLDAPMPARSTRIVVTCLEEASRAWRMLRQQQEVDQAVILVPAEGLWFSAERLSGRNWQLARRALPQVQSPRRNTD